LAEQFAPGCFLTEAESGNRQDDHEQWSNGKKRVKGQRRSESRPILAGPFGSGLLEHVESKFGIHHVIAFDVESGPHLFHRRKTVLLATGSAVNADRSPVKFKPPAGGRLCTTTS
jgi:hypothetical protein